MKEHFPSWIRPALRGASLGFGAVSRVRKLAYDREWLKSHRASVPVVSVGNLVAGGTGKTPVVRDVCQQLSSFRVAVVMRGYGGRGTSRGVLVSRGEGPVVPPEVCGDEAWWHAKKGASVVVVDADRVRGVTTAAQAGAQLVILDDGFSHRRLARDLDVLVVDDSPLRFLPWGDAREPSSARARADFVVSGCSKDCDFGFRLRPSSIGPAFELGEEPGVIAGQSVALWAAIARPERFESTVTELGARVVGRSFARDHASRGPADLREFVARSRESGAQRVITTEKDAARLAGQLPDGVSVLAVEVAWNDSPQPLYEAIKKLLLPA